MQQNIFRPFGMRDAGFFVPGEKRSCFVTLYRSDEQGKLIADSGGGGLAGNYSAQPTAPSGRRRPGVDG
jgi:CubicO group peptidase (beta-lactamase class C family)